MITEFSLFLFTLLGGTAAGAYALAWAFPASDDKKRLALPLVALILLAISGVALLLHLGRPDRMLLAFSNPAAGITQEGLATGLFGALVFVNLIFALRKGKTAPKALGIATGIAGIILIAVMGFAYTTFFGVRAWVNWTTVPLFVVGGLSAGAGLLPLVVPGVENNKAFAICAAVLNVLFACTAIATGLHFASLGLSMTLFVCGAIAAVAAAITAYAAKGRNGLALPALCFVLAFAAVAIARYGFYMIV